MEKTTFVGWLGRIKYCGLLGIDFDDINDGKVDDLRLGWNQQVVWTEMDLMESVDGSWAWTWMESKMGWLMAAG